MRPRKRNDVFHMTSVGVQPRIKVNEADTTRFQNSIDLDENIMRLTQMLDRVNRIHDVNALIL